MKRRLRAMAQNARVSTYRIPCLRVRCRDQPVLLPPGGPERRDAQADYAMPKPAGCIRHSSSVVQDATEDYLREIGNLAEVNSKFMGGWLGSIGKAEAPVPFETRTPPARDRSESRKVTVNEAAA